MGNNDKEMVWVKYCIDGMRKERMRMNEQRKKEEEERKDFMLFLILKY